MVYDVANKADLTRKLTEAGTKLVVIDFYATWCGPCKAIAPRLETLAQQMPGVVFLKVNVDGSKDLASEYEVSAMPTFILIKNGRKVGSLTGADYNTLLRLINENK